jgi:hypothetical protein
MGNSVRAFCLALAWFQCAGFSAEAADSNGVPPRFSDYRLIDQGLKVVGIDSDPTESFLALELDSAGRLFAGGREALYVYEPAEGGLYQPRKLLYRFPKNSWIYGLAIRGTDVFVSTHTAVYVLEGAVLKRDDIKPKRLLWGQPMLPYFEEHQGMHALAFGPEGDLYFWSGMAISNAPTTGDTGHFFTAAIGHRSPPRAWSGEFPRTENCLPRWPVVCAIVVDWPSMRIGTFLATTTTTRVFRRNSCRAGC